jgi:hypothetical protein
MRPLLCVETLGISYPVTRRHIPEEPMPVVWYRIVYDTGVSVSWLSPTEVLHIYVLQNAGLGLHTCYLLWKNTKEQVTLLKDMYFSCARFKSRLG